MVKRSIHLRSVIPVMMIAVLLVIQIFSPARPVMFVLVSVSLILAVSYLWARQLSYGVSIQRKRRYGWAQVGDIIQERWIMHNNSWVPVLWAEIAEHSDLVGYDASRAVGLGSRSSHRWTTQGSCRMRGIFTLGPLVVSMGDPFGLFRVDLRYEHTDTFVVYPQVAALPELVQPRGMARGTARTRVYTQEFTTNASSVRAYVVGDALKRIHWRSTARRSMPEQESLFVKEFDLEPSGDLWIILDMDQKVHAGEGQESTQEYAVTLAASLASQMLRSNRAVGLATYDSEPVLISPQKGHNQLWEILQVLAGVYAVADVSVNELLTLLAPAVNRNISVVVITPSSNSEWIEGLATLLTHGVHSTALLLDAATFGGMNGMAGVHGALADLGVTSHIIDKSFALDVVIKGKQQQPEYRVLGTGRVVVVDPGQEADWVPVDASGRADA